MENEKTYEQWEIEQKEKLAQIYTEELIIFAASVATALVQSLLFTRVNIINQKDPVVIDENRLEDMKDKIAKCAVMMDVLQLRFGDVAEQEVTFLEEMQQLMEQLAEG